MERVVTINLNGNPYQLDESAYDALRVYLTHAEGVLADNPDKSEIIRDLEQAVADKCAAYLSAHKSVVSADEMNIVLAQMGPVEGDAGARADASSSAAPAGSAGPTKRLYRVRDRGSVTGVSGGLGAYFDLDPNIVRLLWIVGALITSGVLVVAYIVLMFVLPLAANPEQIAAAHGAPFNAEQVIERAKREYAKFAGHNYGWDRQGRREWRRAWREQARAWRRAWSYPPPGAAVQVNPVSRVFGGLFALVFAIVGAALLVAFLLAVISLISTGMVLSWTPPASVPLWLTILVLCIVFGVLNGLVRTLQGVSISALTGYPYWRRYDRGLGSSLVLVIVAWIAYTYIPEAHAWMDQAWVVIRNAFNQLFPSRPQ